MDYKIEELLLAVTKLTEKYTSKESTSVPYEMAGQLLESVLYCVNTFTDSGDDKMLAGDRVDCVTAYTKGYQRVLGKVEQAKAIYHQMIQQFQDYGCKNYSDTIILAMPAFFMKYDPQFNAQDHILTLDYPVLCVGDELTGVNLILAYLEEAEYEQRFLEKFQATGIVNLLESIVPDYRALYLDNLCDPVLLRALACLITEQNIDSLELEARGQEKTAAFFEKIADDMLEKRVATLLDIIEQGVMKQENKKKFQSCAPGFTARIRAGVQF